MTTTPEILHTLADTKPISRARIDHSQSGLLEKVVPDEALGSVMGVIVAQGLSVARLHELSTEPLAEAVRLVCIVLARSSDG